MYMYICICIYIYKHSRAWLVLNNVYVSLPRCCTWIVLTAYASFAQCTTTCSLGEYIFETCNNKKTSDIVCKPCKNDCGFGRYLVGSCTGRTQTDNVSCALCRQACDPGISLTCMKWKFASATFCFVARTTYINRASVCRTVHGSVLHRKNPTRWRKNGLSRLSCGWWCDCDGTRNKQWHYSFWVSRWSAVPASARVQPGSFWVEIVAVAEELNQWNVYQ